MSVRDALRSAPLAGDVPGLRLLKVGDGWDVVRTCAEMGLLALAYLRGTGACVGPVLYDKPNSCLYYAVPTGTAACWDGLPVRHLSSDSWLVAPGLELLDDWFGGWCELPDDDTLTDSDALRTALQHPYTAVARDESHADACRPEQTPRRPQQHPPPDSEGTS
ncbi:hypothetical protein [Streptomyces cylindrosporus]|uniref:Uncharacterized protein n=1 Tax=Streptomyces cylindrosporus TaxID=2927583 RepID=A0ABS9YID7_9ACTN|nr:hypothetical protein [Streptomyces cylindrosporus]MCI3277012.1 hypothetical protein [Streptomyces cylindrosporus]